MEALSLLSSFPAVLRVSHDLAAIQRSNQLQPQCGLLGSVNNVFTDLDEFFHWPRKIKKIFHFYPLREENFG